MVLFFVFQAEDGIRDLVRSRGLGDVYKRQGLLVLFSGFASLFAGITGEKQQRITEQMLSMVQPLSLIHI